MNENPANNHEVIPINNIGQIANMNNEPNQRNKLVILDQTEINTNVRLVYDQQGQANIQISYEKNEKVMFFAGGKSQIKNNKEKAKPNQYNTVNVDDPELFDGKIKCVKFKCIIFGIITGFLNTIRLIYLLFLHLGYPAIVWLIRFLCAIFLFCYTFLKDDPETKELEPETGLERIDYERGKMAKAFSLCVNCAKAFAKFFINFVKCPCWFYHLVVD